MTSEGMDVKAFDGRPMTEYDPLCQESSDQMTIAVRVKKEFVPGEDEINNTGKENYIFNCTEGLFREFKTEELDAGPEDDLCEHVTDSSVVERDVMLHKEEDIKEEKEGPWTAVSGYSSVENLQDTQSEEKLFHSFCEVAGESSSTIENLEYERELFLSLYEEAGESNSSTENLENTESEEKLFWSLCEEAGETFENKFNFKVCFSPAPVETEPTKNGSRPSMYDGDQQQPRTYFDASGTKLVNVSVVLEDLFQKISRNKSLKPVQRHINSKFCQCIFCTGRFKLQDGIKNFTKAKVSKSILRSNLCSEHVGELIGENWNSCTICPARFRFMHNLTRHSAADHSVYLCTECHQKFQLRLDLQSHLKTHPAKNPYVCAFCSFKSRVEAELKVHTRIHSTEKFFSCAKCFIEFDKSHSLLDHLQEHCYERCVTPLNFADLRPYSNPEPAPSESKQTSSMPSNKQELLNSYCPAPFKQNVHQTFNSTSIAAAQSFSFTADECRSTSMQNVNTSKILNEDMLQLPVNSNEESSVEGKLRSAIGLHLKQFSCLHCAAKFTTKRGLISHSNVHSNNYPYSCSCCPAKFKFQIGFSRHLALHSSNKYSCAHCNASFKAKALLRQHLSNAKLLSCAASNPKFNSRKMYSCVLCAATFKFASSLENHLLNHSMKRRFSCPHCSVTFKLNAHLTQHLSVHSDARPFLCSECADTFKSKRDLKQHLVTYSNERRFSCGQCAATFKCKRILMRHLTLHSSVKPFACEFCTAAFKRKDVLKLHLSNWHSNQCQKNKKKSAVAKSRQSSAAEAAKNEREYPDHYQLQLD